MTLQRPKPAVEVRKLLDAMPDRDPLLCDELAELGRNPLAVTRGAQDGQLTRSTERQVERSQTDKKTKPLQVRRRVAPIPVRLPRRRRQQARRFVESHDLGRRARQPRHLADPYGPNPRPSSYWNVKDPELSQHVSG